MQPHCNYIYQTMNESRWPDNYSCSWFIFSLEKCDREDSCTYWTFVYLRKVHKFKGHRGFCSLYKNCTLNRNGRGKIIGKLEKSTCNILVDPKVVHILVKQKKIIRFFLIKFFLENCPKDWTFYRTTSMCYKFYKEKSKWQMHFLFVKRFTLR